MDVDVAIIGGGQAGVPLARSLAEAGQQVALIERVHLGGSCVNFGCTPSKALIASAQVAYEARNGERWGIRIPTIDVDFGAVMDRVRGMVAAARNSLDDSIEQAANPCLIRAHGRLAGREDGRFVVESDGGRVRARRVVLDTGTRSLLPDIDGLRTVPLLTAENWIDMTVLPERLIVIGGSYLALEFGQAFSRLESEVVVLQSGSALAEREDPDVSYVIAKFLEAEGLEIRLDVRIDRIEPIDGGIRVHVDGVVLEGTHLLVATGRRPNTDDLGLETLGVATDQHGMIEVDERLATTVAGVWAAGDIRGGPAFTHTAYADSKVIHDQIVGDSRMTTERIVPYAMFLDPELGRVGMTETEARKAGHAIRIGRKDMSTSGKAKEVGQTAGFIKVVIDAETDRFLGAACLCHNGSEVVQVFIALMNAGAGANTIKNSVVIHPTIGEAAKNAVVAAYT
ncbi:mercuric reductase [Lichenicola cladoniae]|uniref:Mercuric reductase n=1 Tax=Lichenicola cladoniae TaxID=1484109 RepID=A0A6M8HMA2_9PROT|nr:mercuric reductase [Lichenicola cladoniae]NPD66900.1 mercuric reductase [Acetobacteraceae bacterium]QKE89457.1 mercuric reductase [Lichenicola cladoniae]